jgi:hypothetical protein
MAKSTTFDNDLLKLILNGTAIANIADNAAASPLTNLYVALHTADPTASGNQTSSEVATGAYSTYARQPVARTPGSPAWTVTGNSASPNANIVFPTPTGSPTAVATFFSVGTLVSGTGKILYSGALTSPITVTAGTAPTLLASGSTITES